MTSELLANLRECRETIMEIKLATEEDRGKWGEFVKENDGTLFHTFTWRDIVKDSLGYKPYYFYAEENGSIKAICPFFLSMSFLFGGKFLSQGDSVGPLGDANAGREILLKAAEMGKSLGLDQIVIHDLKPEYLPAGKGFVEPWKYVSFLIDLKKSEEELLMSFKPYLRRDIRRELKRNKIEFLDIDSESKLKTFYKMYQDNMHFLGTPPLAFSFFKAMFDKLHPKRIFGFILKYNGEEAGGVINLVEGTKVRCFLSMTQTKYRNTNVNAVLIWESLKRSHGVAEIFDFGGSRPDSGNYEFKLKWNPLEISRPLVYKLLSKKAVITDPRNKKLKRYAGIWRRIPRPICNIIGPHVRRMMGR